VRNGGESDVDCGGACAAKCADHAGCLAAGDCRSGVCLAGICQGATCTDGVENGAETDVDCGPGCAACGVGGGCSAARDCLSGACIAGVCRPQPAAICTGREHTCALSDGGRVLCWGDDSNGELGNGVVVDYRLGPTYVKGISDATQITCGDHGVHACALRATGEIACWGWNDAGQLGDGTTTDRAAPVTVNGITNAVQVVAGEEFTCARLSTGGVKCWGSDANGQLGNGSGTSSTTPVDVAAGQTGSGALSSVVYLASGQQHTCAILDAAHSGRLVCWGNGGTGRLGDAAAVTRTSPVYTHAIGDATACDGSTPAGCLEQVAAIALGDDSTVAVQKGGLASAWGSNASESLATGAATQFPLRMHGLGSAGTFDDAEYVAMGMLHGCAIRKSGQAVCWGEDDNGRTGENDGVNVNLSAPTPVADVATYSQIDAGDAYSCGFVADGSAKCWGYNGQGELGDGTGTQRVIPTDVAGGRGFVEVDAGVGHTCGVTGAGDVYCWGFNASGELGIGNTEERWAAAKIQGLEPASDVVALEFGSCALAKSGTVSCWGNDLSGENGDGTVGNPTDRTAPLAVAGVTNAVEIAGGLLHVCALVDPPPVGDGVTSVWCWGYNGYGQLGNATTADSPTPVQVHGVGNTGMLTDAVALGAGFYHTCAIRATGEVACWGRGDQGQLGNGLAVNETSPVAVSGVFGFGTLGSMAKGRHVIDGSAENTCALATNGNAFCWGNSANGENGAGTTFSTMLPVQVSGTNQFVRISAFSDVTGHVCAVNTGGQAYCWGSNTYGQLGDGTTTDRAAPTLVQLGASATSFGNPDLSSKVVAISTGQYHTVAAHAAGSVSGWGQGGNGRLGDGRNDGQTAPVAAAKNAAR
jgi:alpha-tubulin suppressor-like RCC1 family protein